MNFVKCSAAHLCKCIALSRVHLLHWDPLWEASICQRSNLYEIVWCSSTPRANLDGWQRLGVPYDWMGGAWQAVDGVVGPTPGARLCRHYRNTSCAIAPHRSVLADPSRLDVSTFIPQPDVGVEIPNPDAVKMQMSYVDHGAIPIGVGSYFDNIWSYALA